MNALSPPISRGLRVYSILAKATLWLLLAAWLALVVAWAGVHAWIVPRIGQWRGDIEVQASRALGIPVRLGSVSARSEGLLPTFEFRDVVLADAAGREALRLPLVVVAVSPRSLWGLGFEQLYIHQPELDVRRDSKGRIFVAGLDVSRPTAESSGVADWFFRQRELVIQGGSLRWTDELRAAPTLSLSAVELVVRNTARRHAIRLDATPEAAWGERFSLRGQFRQPVFGVRAGDWQRWDGQIYAQFPRVDLSSLRRHVRLDVDLAGGHGAVRGWLDVRQGQPVGVVADLNVDSINVRFAPQLDPLALRSFSGRLAGRSLEGGFELRTRDLQFQFHEGQRWPGGNVDLVWQDHAEATRASGELKADRLDLGALGQVASHLPLGTPTLAALARHQAQGIVERMNLKWRGRPEAPLSYEGSALLSGLILGMDRKGPMDAALPGVRGARVEVDLSQRGGRAKVNVAQGALWLPHVFEDATVPIESLSADVQWDIQGDAWAVKIPQLRFANADMAGEAQLSWRTSDPGRSAQRSRWPGVLDLKGTLSRADGTRVYRYLPLGVSKTAREYVQESVRAASVTGAQFRVRGDLHDFPFVDPRAGEFRVTGQIKDVTYAYVPPVGTEPAWPALSQMSAELVFDRVGMAVRGAAGRIQSAGGAPLAFKADARIADLRATQVQVQGDIQGGLEDMLGVVGRSALAELTGHALDGPKGSGPVELKLQLQLPLAHLERSRVAGTVTLAGNELQWSSDTPSLTRARGQLSFSERGFALHGVQARVLGGETRLEGSGRVQGPDENIQVQLRAQGVVTADGLRAAPELGVVARLARAASGSAPYTLAVNLRRGVPEMQLSSSLQGMALALPAPLAKSAEQALPFRYENELTPASLSAAGGVPLQDQLRLELGRAVQAQYVRELKGDQVKVLRGALAMGLDVGEGIGMPTEGVAASIKLPTFNVGAWTDVFSASTGVALSPDPALTDAHPALAYLPSRGAASVRELVLGKQSLHNVVIGGSREGGLWRASVSADELNGYLEYRLPTAGAPAGAVGRLHARLARLSLGAGTTSQVESLLDESPNTIPALDILVDEFELRGKSLGRLEIEAVNRSPGGGDSALNEWRLSKLNLSVPEARFSATGNWAAVGAQAPDVAASSARSRPERRRSVMNFRWDIADAGVLLNRLGMKDVFRQGKGRLEGQVAWLGSPLALDYPSLSGVMQVEIESGQFLKADPGLAKLLGVLSLQSLPRRLTLDFRDVFTEGFAFDFIRGDVNVAQGVASTNNLQMKGVNAAVLMEGKADIARETQDLRVVVVPEINAGSASLIATVINPAVGLGTFLAQLVLRQPLIRAATQEFRVDGTWSEPRVQRSDLPREPVAPNPSAGGE